MKITPKELRDLANAVPIFADHFNSAADEIERQNNELENISKFKKEVIEQAISRVSSGAIKSSHKFMIIDNGHCYISTRALRELADVTEGGE